MSAGIDLHALANLHGFGKAKEVLQSAGHWDAHARAGNERQKFTVEIAAEFTARTVIEVMARSKDEARELAEDKASIIPISQWDIEGDPDLSVETVLPPA